MWVVLLLQPPQGPLVGFGGLGLMLCYGEKGQRDAKVGFGMVGAGIITPSPGTK